MTERFSGMDVKGADDIDELRDTGVCVLLYGPAGVGKTPTACNVVRSEKFGAPALLVDCAGGTRSVTHLVTAGLLEVVRPEKWDDLETLVRDIHAVADEKKYKSYIFDNASEMSAIRAQAILAEKNRKHHEIQDWNVITMAMLQMARKLRDASEAHKVNIIINCWESPEKDQATGTTKRDVAFNPALRIALPGIVDLVGHITVNDSESRKLSFEPSDFTAARIRRPDSDDALVSIPDNIWYGVKEYPMAALVDTLRGGLPWPTNTFKRR